MRSLLQMAREAGRAGRDYMDWTCDDEVQTAVESGDFDTDAIEAEFCAGRAEHRAATGWRVLWTTAPEDYDTFGTETLEHCGEWRGRSLRRVVIDPRYGNYQAGRYGSGLHGAFEEDPREADARAVAEREAERTRQAEREARRAAGIAWLATATDAELEDADTVWEHSVEMADARAERTEREDRALGTVRAAEWARCAALVPEGAYLADDGSPPKPHPHLHAIPGRDPHAWYRVAVRPGWPADDPDRADVIGEGGDIAGSLVVVAAAIERGDMRVVTESELPPRPVVERIGHPQRKRIVRVEVGGRAVWIGRASFASDPLVLDERGHKARGKIVAAAMEKFHGDGHF